MAIKEPIPRFGGSKVRSGCLTCKARRVKCDESKPSCLRCLKRKIKCEGYGPPKRKAPSGSKFVHVTFVPKQPRSYPNLGPAEQRSLHFFELVTVSDLAGQADGFSHQEWAGLLIQRAFSELAIRHGIVALGALHENLATDATVPSPKHSFALQQYRQAMQHVIQLDASRSSAALDTMLTSAILFTAFESLQGRNKLALNHFVNGIKILTEMTAKGGNSRDTNFHRQVLRSVLMSLDAQALKIVDSKLEQTPDFFCKAEKHETHTKFTSVDEARTWLDELLHRFHCFYRRRKASLSMADTTGHTIAQLALDHASIKNAFANWTVRLSRSTFSSPAVLILQISKIMAQIVLNLDITLGELGWDAFTSSFEEIVEFAESFIKQRQKQQTQNPNTVSFTFSFSTGILKPLQVTAHRCRHPAIRRRALHVLQTCNRKEGFWTSDVAAVITERIIEIEEDEAVLGSDKVVTAPSQIPEEARVTSLETAVHSDGVRRLIYRKTGSYCLSMEKIGLSAVKPDRNDLMFGFG